MALLAPATLVLRADVLIEPNRGQTDPSVRYLITGSLGAVFLTDRETVVRSPSGGAVRWTHPGSNPAAPFQPSQETATRKTYIRRQNATALPTYERLFRRELYPGIDLDYHASGENLEYDYVVAPGADPSRIRLRFAAGTKWNLLPDGSLESESAGARYRHKAPVAYTRRGGRRTPVAARFRKIGALEVGFSAGAYDKEQTLVIDPEITSLELQGGSGDDELTLAFGSSVRAGTTLSLDFPGAAIQTRPSRDVWFRAPTAGGTRILVIGGSGDDRPLALYPFGSSYIIGGETTSRDFPVAARFGSTVFQPEYAGGESDGFLIGIPFQDSAFFPVESTYLGGDGADRVKGIAESGRGLAVAGETSSADFPGMRAFQAPRRGETDVFLLATSFLTGGSLRPVGLKIIGGSGPDYFGGIAFGAADSVGNGARIYHVVGETASSDIASGLRINGPSDAFWAAIPATVEQLGEPEFVRLFGGEGADRFSFVRPPAAAGVRDWLFAGETSSPTLPGTALEGSSYRGGADIIAAWFDPSAGAWARHRFIGGTRDERLITAVWSNRGVILGGMTESQDLQTSNAFQQIFGGGASDGLAAFLDSDDSTRMIGYLGGNGRDSVSGAWFESSTSLRLNFAGSSDSSQWSAALPIAGAPPTPRGGMDWFEAGVLASRRPGPDRFLLVPGVLTRLAPDFPVTPRPGTTVTLTSSAPGNVRLTSTASLNGGASIQIRASATGFSDGFAFPVAQAGTATIRVDAPGEESALIPAQIGLLRLAFQPSPASVDTSRIAMGTSVPAVIGRLEFVYQDQVSPVLPGSLIFPGANPRWRIESLTPDTIAVSPRGDSTSIELSFDPYSEIFFPLVPVSVGPYRVRLSLPGTNLDPVELTGAVTEPTVRFTLGTVGAGQTSSQRANTTGPLNLRLVSTDPSKLALSLPGGEPSGQVALDLPGVANVDFFIHGREAGEAAIRAEANGSLVLETPVSVLPLAVAMSSAVAGNMVPGSEASVGSIGLAHVDPLSGRAIPVLGALSPPVTATIRLRESDPSILRLIDREVTVRPGAPVPIRVGATRPGTELIEVVQSSTIPISPKHASVEVTVREPGAGRLGPFVVGENLRSAVTIDLPFNDAQLRNGFAIVSSDPSRVLVSRPGVLASPRIDFDEGSRSVAFAIHGRAAGEAVLNIEVAGFEPVPVRVRTWPAGYLFTTPEVRTRAGSNAFVFATIHPVDPDSGLPGPAQSWTFGAPVLAPQISVSDGSLAALDAGNFTGDSPARFQIIVAARAAGSASINLSQPVGLAAPRVRQSIPLNIDPR